MATLEAKLVGLTCPRCGRENTYAVHEIDYTAGVGDDTVMVSVRAGVCGNCGEQLLDTAATDKIADAVKQLRDGTLTGLVHTGEAYRYS